jgi:hypothetical protein
VKTVAVGCLLLGLSPACIATSAEARDQSVASVSPIRATALAPADSYFGRFQMSVLGIRNSIKDISLRVDTGAAYDSSSLYHKLTMIEDALLDLKDRFPHDSWLPQLGLGLAQVFAKIPFPAAQVHANDELDWVVAEYPNTNQASYASDMLRLRLGPTTVDVPIEPTLPSNAVP